MGFGSLKRSTPLFGVYSLQAAEEFVPDLGEGDEHDTEEEAAMRSRVPSDAGG
jgi:hypothetical protein